LAKDTGTRQRMRTEGEHRFPMETLRKSFSLRTKLGLGGLSNGGRTGEG